MPKSMREIRERWAQEREAERRHRPGSELDTLFRLVVALVIVAPFAIVAAIGLHAIYLML